MLEQIISFILALIFMINTLIAGVKPFDDGLRIVVPEDWELCVGESRTLDCVFEDSISDRSLEWSVSPEELAEVDEWGRVTALGTGTVTVTAKGSGIKDSVTLNVVAQPTLAKTKAEKVDYAGDAVKEVGNYEKIVTRYAPGNKSIPDFITSVKDYADYQTAVTADGSVWEITAYGVKRTARKAATGRDVIQHFMGDRYFYSNDTSAPNVLAVFPDGGNGIWTLMKSGVTHIDMQKMSGSDKAAQMSAITQQNISRHGMVDCAYGSPGNMRSYESDNDGLWTSMYGAGELMRYAVLKNDPLAKRSDVAAARKAAYLSSEAVLMLSYISARTGTTEAYVRQLANGSVTGGANDHRYTSQALLAGGNGSVFVPGQSPAQQFNAANDLLRITGSASKFNDEKLMAPFYPEAWADTSANPGADYAKQTRNLEGFIARTYSLKQEGNGTWGNIYWSMNGDGTATGVSSIPQSDEDYIINGENMRGAVVDASGEIPARLWNDLIGSGYTVSDIIYKGDTSADEFIGHMFIYKLMYDILGPEDAELKRLVVDAVDRIARHFADNGYQMIDGTGQATTWGKFSRQTFLSGSGLGMAPLHCEVMLSIFKTAAYITGYQKWENEYRLAALDPAYEYADVMNQYYERAMATAALVVTEELGSSIGGQVVEMLGKTELCETLFRLLLNYSDEEMAMLGFYLLFQEETDEAILDKYRGALSQWWISIQYSENPLWYYIYQLAYPTEELTDAYGNNILKTAAWSLSRTPFDLTQYGASNANRDDIAVLGIPELGGRNNVLSYNPAKGTIGELDTSDPKAIVKYVIDFCNLEWAVAAPDERTVHKFNNNTYDISGNYSPNCLEASTIYTLPYWMGVYHSMLTE